MHIDEVDILFADVSHTNIEGNSRSKEMNTKNLTIYSDKISILHQLWSEIAITMETQPTALFYCSGRTSLLYTVGNRRFHDLGIAYNTNTASSLILFKNFQPNRIFKT